ncbi:MAG: hypothetical protein ACI30A_05935, partial [Paludibacteraceae bacterium]
LACNSLRNRTPPLRFGVYTPGLLRFRVANIPLRSIGLHHEGEKRKDVSPKAMQSPCRGYAGPKMLRGCYET